MLLKKQKGKQDTRTKGQTDDNGDGENKELPALWMFGSKIILRNQAAAGASGLAQGRGGDANGTGGSVFTVRDV